MSIFAQDTFTGGSAASNLTAHTGETGATWTEHTSYTSGDFLLTGTGYTYPKAFQACLDYASGVPGGTTPADYDVSAAVKCVSTRSNELAGVAGRIDTADNTFYRFVQAYNSVVLYRKAAGTNTFLAQVLFTPTVGETYTITMQMRGTGSTIAITCQCQRASDSNYLTSGAAWQASAANCITYSDTDATRITAAGRAGVYAESAGATAESNGFHIDSFTATDLASGGGDTTAPTITARSVNAAGTTLTLTADEAITAGAGGNGGFTLTASGGAVTLTYSAGSGSTSVTYTTSRTILSGETLTLAYTQPGNGWEDAAGNDLATFSGQSVTNNSTQTASLSAGSVTATTVKLDLTASAASGGTSPYAYQWYGSTTNGFTPGAGNLLSGQTGQNLSGYTVTPGSTYYFVRRVTDNASATADTSQYTVTAVSGAGGTTTYSRGRLVNA